jgi:hypothetical protein
VAKKNISLTRFFFPSLQEIVGLLVPAVFVRCPVLLNPDPTFILRMHEIFQSKEL